MNGTKMNLLKSIVFVSYINEETLGATFGTRSNIEKFVAGWSGLYYFMLIHFLLFILKMNAFFHLTHSKIFLITIALIAVIIPLFVIIFLCNYNWTGKYYKEIGQMNMSKKRMWTLAIIFMLFPILYFYVTLFLLKIPCTFLIFSMMKYANDESSN